MRLQRLLKKETAHKIALYIRVSTEEQASNPEGSIKSQEQRLRQHVELQNQNGNSGEIVATFIDRARSGKDTNRPELRRLLRAIRNREVSLVIVTELSRLSRSIKDFCEIWDLMRSCECEFQSLREQFDTTSAAGEMILYTIANIAQFERKQTAERTRLNFQARAERGLFNGGAVPFGFRRNPDKKGHLIVDETEALIVREIFSTFLSEGSLTKAGISLNERGFRLTRRREGGGSKARLGYFTVGNLWKILSNPLYAGLRRYTVKGEERTVKASWDGIIDPGAFDRTQKILIQNHRRDKSRRKDRYPYTLSGRVFCAQCGDYLTGKSAHGNGGKIGYYEHAWATRRQSCLKKKTFPCSPHRVAAKRLEGAVWDEITRLLSSPEIAKSLIDQAQKEHGSQGQVKEKDQLRARVREADEQLEALAEHLTQIPKGVSPAPIYAQMQKVETKKSEAAEKLNELDRDVRTDEPVGIRDYQEFLSTLKTLLTLSDSGNFKAQLVKWLMAKIEVLPNSFRLHFYVGKNHVIPIKWEQENGQSVAGSKGSEADGKYPAGKTRDFFCVGGSNTIANGVGDGN